MKSVTYNSTRYHEHLLMEKWCYDNIGKGGWLCVDNLVGDSLWSIYTMFGNTTLSFRLDSDYEKFIKEWRDE